ncbi:MAG TPA: M1 family metallopeptidase [Bacteroidia bacterium]|nr:M1 family metallopeptidase [Bacteroidia bacterium]HNT79333.1 M1 family metallopeptidase [Bacteroidia bacterium]
MELLKLKKLLNSNAITLTQKILALSISALLFSCSSEIKKTSTSTMSKDDHSFAKADEISIHHIDLNLKVDFEQKTLAGKARLYITHHTKVDSIFLDTRKLSIQKIQLSDGTETPYRLSEEDALLGSQLAIKVAPNTEYIDIAYSTDPTAAALQWLVKEQTAGKQHPFLFTQSQAILARSWIPLQDSPGIRFTYSAAIQVPQPLIALMSARSAKQDSLTNTFYFEMKQAIPSYLMALSVGHLQYHAYDQRCGVFAEPEMIEKAAYEFADMPSMISSAEELYGPYAWEQYDVLVLPPSFPFGGMENPRLTFATPTIIAGDRSLVALIAHELAHSWSGNLVTNATWNDFWLNEGFTVYFESRIMEKLYGKPYADMLIKLSYDELSHTLEEMKDHADDTHLYLQLKGRDPDEGLTDIAYEKGRFFLRHIEQTVGREKWDAFLKGYFSSHAFKSITTTAFLEYLQSHLLQSIPGADEKIKLNEWVYGAGLPPVFLPPSSEELTRVEKSAEAFLSNSKAEAIDTNGYSSHHFLHLLRSLSSSISKEQLGLLDQRFNFSNSGNSEVLSQWLLLSIQKQYGPAMPQLENFLLQVGRRKFLKPLYSALAKTPEGKEEALRIYSKARDSYHSVSYGTIDQILGYTP